MKGMCVNDELEMIWMEAAVATFKVSLQGTILAFAWKDWGKSRTPKDSRPPSRDLKPGPPEYEEIVLINRPWPLQSENQ